nr:uncharacterized protein LOC119626585 [Chlorocebus sabaeus]
MEGGTRAAWLGRGAGLGPRGPLGLWASVSREEKGSRAAGPPYCGVLLVETREEQSPGLLRCASSNCWETPHFSIRASLSWAGRIGQPNAANPQWAIYWYYKLSLSFGETNFGQASRHCSASLQCIRVVLVA